MFDLCTMPIMKMAIFKKKIAEMHKNLQISSFFFCAFALKYKLGSFVLSKYEK